MRLRKRPNDGISFKTAKLDPNNLSPLECLPSELTFAIFDYVPERVLHVRQASTLLHSRANEYALQRTTIQLVDELRFETKGEHYKRLDQHAHRISVTVALPKDRAGLFELRYQLRRGATKNPLKRERHDIPDQLTLYKFGLFKNNAALWKCVEASIGIRIGRVSCFECSEKNTFATVFRHVRDFQFKDLEVKCHPYDGMTNDVGDSLLNMIESHQIDHLQLSMSFGDKYSKEFLRKVSSLVRSLHIDPYCMLGTDDDFAQIILDMLSRKIDKLFIEERDFFKSVFREDAIEVLVARIPLLEKKIWFQASFHPFFETEDTIRSHSGYEIYESKRYGPKRDYSDIRANRVLYDDHSSLNIKHASRAQEPHHRNSNIAQNFQFYSFT